jgi:hypothetical protein
MKQKNKRVVVPKMNPVDVTKDALAYAMHYEKDGMKKLLKRHRVNVPEGAKDKDIHVAVLMTSAKNKAYRDELSKFLAETAADAPSKMGSQSFTGGQWNFTGLDDFSFTGDEQSIRATFFDANGKGYKNVEGDVTDPTSTNYDATQDPNSPLYGGSNSVANSISAPSTPTIDTSVTTTDTTIQPSGSNSVSAPAASSGGNVWGSIGGFLANNIFTKQNIQSGINIGLTKIAADSQGKLNQSQLQAQQINQRQAQLGSTSLKPKVGTTSSTTTYLLVGLGVAAIIGIMFFAAKKMKK